MCGRIVQKFRAQELRQIVNVKKIFSQLKPRYNIAPSQSVAIIRLDKEEQPALVELKWGFVPHWAKRGRDIKPQINARGESIDVKPFFKTSFKDKRCLVPVSGFYEWKLSRQEKVPYYIYKAGDTPFLLAGLWDEQAEAKEQSFAIVTIEAKGVLARIHKRMPLVLDGDKAQQWLRGSRSDALELIRAPEISLESHRVSTIVNSPSHDSEECIKALPDIL